MPKKKETQLEIGKRGGTPNNHEKWKISGPKRRSGASDYVCLVVRAKFIIQHTAMYHCSFGLNVVLRSCKPLYQCIQH